MHKKDLLKKKLILNKDNKNMKRNGQMKPTKLWNKMFKIEQKIK